jgi:predicted phage terminase large subunit-like protein
VVGDTKVITREGQLCIKELCQCNPIPDVLSYDHAQGKTRWGKVTAYKISQAKNILKVQAEGRTLKCTKEHLIYTDEGYKPAHTVHDKKVFCLGQGNVFGTQAIVTAAMEPNDVECAVYDTQVEVTHNFFADGILVHNCAIIDDPLRSREDADSPLVREAVWDWYSSVLYTRRMPNAALVLVMTRWHQLDLAGRLLEAQDNGGDKWEILELPAIKNEGTDYEEALWPSWYPLEELKRTRSVLVPRDWQALYQQKPTTDEGAFFKKAWFKRHSPNVHTNAKHMHTYIGTDFAVTDSNGDYTELLVFAQGEDNVSYLIDGYSGQSTANVWIDKLLDFVVAYKPLAVFGESGVIRRAIEPFLIKRMRERNTFARMVWVASITDKATRARAFQARAAMGNVSLPNTHFGERVLGQLTGFPGTKYDDAVDACGVFARGLEDVHAHLVTSSPSQTRRSLREVQREAEGVDFWRIV